MVRLSDATITARRVIVAVGGSSYPGCGTTGDGYAIARRFGHTIVDTKPALVPLRVGADWVPSLKGLSLPDVVASVSTAKGDVLQQRREALLFTHFGLSGPSILDVSRAAAHRVGSEPLVLTLDLLPSISREELDRRLQTSSRQGRRAVVTLLPAELPRRLAECVLSVAAIPAQSDRPGPVPRRTPPARDRAQRALVYRSWGRSDSKRPRSPAAGSRSTRSTPKHSRAGWFPACTSLARSSTSTA